MRLWQRLKNRKAICLIDKWLRDKSGYDEDTWPVVKRAIERNATSNRRRFRDD